MKIIIIGDIHGRGLWKEVVANELKEKEPHTIVFIGDYFDSRDGISSEDQINNFLDIIRFKKDQASAIDVILLIGNHDYHYLPEIQEHYSNYQKDAAETIYKTLEDNMSHLQMAYSHENFLFTHAGVSRDFCDNRNINYDITLLGLDNITEFIAEDLNDRFINEPTIFGFTPNDFMDNHGESVTQTPIWIRPKSLGKSIIPGIRQVVGHTTVEHITTVENKHILAGTEYITSLTLIDTLASREYLVIEDGIMRTETF